MKRDEGEVLVHLGLWFEQCATADGQPWGPTDVSSVPEADDVIRWWCNWRAAGETHGINVVVRYDPALCHCQVSQQLLTVISHQVYIFTSPPVQCPQFGRGVSRMTCCLKQAMIVCLGKTVNTTYCIYSLSGNYRINVFGKAGRSTDVMKLCPGSQALLKISDKSADLKSVS